jgi:hypothetical protein
MEKESAVLGIVACIFVMTTPEIRLNVAIANRYVLLNVCASMPTLAHFIDYLNFTAVVQQNIPVINLVDKCLV